MSEGKLNPQEFEKLMRLKERNIGGPDDAPTSDNPNAIPGAESLLSEDETMEVLKLSASEGGASEDENFKKRAGYGIASQGSNAAAMAGGIVQGKTEAYDEQQRIAIRANIEHWRIQVFKLAPEQKRSFIETFRGTSVRGLIAEEVKKILEQNPDDEALKELYDRINPYA